MAKLLIDAGADPLVKLHQGISPIEIVDENSKDGLMIKVRVEKSQFYQDKTDSGSSHKSY
jgi:hypothetical protein